MAYLQFWQRYWFLFLPFNLIKLHCLQVISWMEYIDAKSLLFFAPTYSYLPPSVSFIIIFFLIIRSKERDCSQILILCTYTSQYAEAMYFAINSRAPALLDCNLNIPVILRRKKKIAVFCILYSFTKLTKDLELLLDFCNH